MAPSRPTPTWPRGWEKIDSLGACSDETLSMALFLLLMWFTQGQPEKLRGPGQRVKVGPFTQAVSCIEDQKKKKKRS